MSTLGNNYVCGSAVWLNELLMHWFYSRQILRYYRFEASAALMDIARNTTKYAYIGIGVYKYFYIKQAAESKALKRRIPSIIIIDLLSTRVYSLRRR